MPQIAPPVATLREGRQRIWHDPKLLPTVPPVLFDLAWLQAEGKLRGTSQGRNSAYFLHHDGLDMVLRHYYRGGLIGRVNKDLFLRQPVAKSRAMAEFTLLAWMRGQGLPVPRPVAARYSGAGLFYRADILLETIPDSQPLADRLLDAPLEAETWQRVGAAIAQMHGAGVLHSDLNCRNILIDGHGQIWLIDFDKCTRRPAGAWAQDNLARLHRSFTKEAAAQTGLHWNAENWAQMLEGYAASATARRGA